MDLKLVETGNGGDIVKNGNFLQLINGLQNMPYLAMFGGNTEQITPRTRKYGEQVFDYWGNSLFFAQNPAIQFNSLTEKTLSTTALNSAGRITIENAVIEDLKFMTKFAKVEVSVSIVGVDKLLISVKIIPLNGLESNEFNYLWDATNSELTSGDTEQYNELKANFALFDDGEFVLFDNGTLINL